jgi:hypothetical protein
MTTSVGPCKRPSALSNVWTPVTGSTRTTASGIGHDELPHRLNRQPEWRGQEAAGTDERLGAAGGIDQDDAVEWVHDDDLAGRIDVHALRAVEQPCGADRGLGASGRIHPDEVTDEEGVGAGRDNITGVEDNGLRRAGTAGR